jgi:signal transduction histidine kinase
VRYFSRRVPWAIFAAAVIALTVIALAAGVTMSSLAESEAWVSHTREVQTALADLRGDVLRAEAACSGFVVTGNAARLQDYQLATQELPNHLATLSALTADNPSQVSRIAALRPLIDQRVRLLQESVALEEAGGGEKGEQQRLNDNGAELTTQILASIQSMVDGETRLLGTRRRISQASYQRTRMLLMVAFAVALLMLAANFVQMLIELRDRRVAEEAIRRLSGRILQMQDAERRKVARELHDSIGQVLAALKMRLTAIGIDSEAASPETREALASCQNLVDQGIDETRTLSHLLHPPLLDELGFASAAKWYVEGFSERSKIQVHLDIPDELGRMPPEVELVLFRVLQESLTNIHRHSESASADIRLESRSGTVRLIIRDYGKGIPANLLERFARTGYGAGVGLAGIRERVNEVGGRLKIESDERGTQLRVEVPLEQVEGFGQGKSPRSKRKVVNPKTEPGVLNRANAKAP